MTNLRDLHIVDPNTPTQKTAVTASGKLTNEAIPTTLSLVQEGKVFSFGNTLDIGGGIKHVVFETPADDKLLMTLILESVDASKFQFFEGTSYDLSSGTAVSIINHELSSGNVLGISPEINPATIVTGTKLADYNFGGNLRGSQSIGGSRDMDIPFILKTSQIYILKVEDLASNIDNAANYTFQMTKSEDFNIRS